MYETDIMKLFGLLFIVFIGGNSANAQRAMVFDSVLVIMNTTNPDQETEVAVSAFKKIKMLEYVGEDLTVKRFGISYVSGDKANLFVKQGISNRFNNDWALKAIEVKAQKVYFQEIKIEGKDTLFTTSLIIRLKY